MNPYNLHKDKFFNRIADLLHSVSVARVLMNSAARDYAAMEGDALLALSNLIISDWTGPDDNGFAIAYHTAASSFTLSHQIEETKERIASVQGCYVYAQAVEALETLIKDCLFTKAIGNESFKTVLRKKMDINGDFDREKISSLKGKLFKGLKAAIPDFYDKKFGNSSYSISVEELFQTFFHCRHAITHASNNLKQSHINPAQMLQVRDMFDVQMNGDILLLVMNEVQMQHGPEKMAEAGFQIYKAFSEAEGLTWTIEVTRPASSPATD